MRLLYVTGFSSSRLGKKERNACVFIFVAFWIISDRLTLLFHSLLVIVAQRETGGVTNGLEGAYGISVALLRLCSVFCSSHSNTLHVVEM